MTTETDPESARTESLWLATTKATDYDPLTDDIDVDVAVVGGGIAGLTTAVELQSAGRTVAVIEADRIVERTTGHTTAKLTSQHGLVYDSLVSSVGERRARQYADANEAAIDAVERRVEGEGIDCDFRRTPAYTYTTDVEDVESIRREVDAATRLGLPATYVEETPLPFDVEAAVRFDDQAAFHPREYLLAVAERIHRDGGRVFEETRATDVDPGRPCRVETERATVTAADVVVATHYPFFDRAGYFARTHPHRAYLLAVRLEGSPPEGLYYSTASPPETIRPYPVSVGGVENEAGREDGGGRPDGASTGGSEVLDDERLLIVGGQSHEPGLTETPTSERYRRCEAFARSHFDVESVAYRWSTMDYSTVDRVPYVGRIDPFSEHVYVATGFDGWGMTGGTAAGRLIADLIVEGSSPWADVFDPQRFTPGASAKRFVAENAAVGAVFVGDRIDSLLSALDQRHEDELPATGEARVIRRSGRPVGLYRDGEGALHAVSATCPHMGCLVRWNDAERTWDCPCHGSRFTHDGEVLSGPALEGLRYRRR